MSQKGEIKRLLVHASKNGFTVLKTKKNVIKIYPKDKESDHYSLHSSKLGFHPLRRFIKKHLG